MEKAGLNVWTCEAVQGDRPFAVTEAGDPRVLQLRTIHQLWLKENMINLMVQKLPWDWEYVAWIDCDVEFVNAEGPNAWYYQTVDLLQNYEIVQLFQNAIDLGPNGEVLKTHTGFVANYVNQAAKKPGYTDWHPGFGWAANRSVWDAMGGLPDFCILGSADRSAAYSWIGCVGDSVDKDIQSPYLDALKVYQARCERFVRRDIGYLPGTILHHFHGAKKNRRYADRWKILTSTHFDPNKHIKRDYQGLWQLSDLGDVNSIRLRDQIRQYFLQRNEDSIDAE